MQANISTWKRLAVAAAIAALPAISYAVPQRINGDNDVIDFSQYPLVNGVATIPGNDCSGAFGQGLENCKIPAFYDGDQSPIIIKFNTFEDDGVAFPTPPDPLIEINSIFASITGEEFKFDCNDPACLTGKWEYTPGVDDPVISFYVAKGGPNFNLFNVAGPVAQGDFQQGLWSTPLRAGLSHISFYDTTGGIPDPRVPEPGMLALLAAGLLGLGVATRRRRA